MSETFVLLSLSEVASENLREGKPMRSWCICGLCAGFFLFGSAIGCVFTAQDVAARLYNVVDSGTVFHLAGMPAFENTVTLVVCGVGIFALVMLIRQVASKARPADSSLSR